MKEFWCLCAEKSLAINRSSPLGEIRRLENVGEDSGI